MPSVLVTIFRMERNHDLHIKLCIDFKEANKSVNRADFCFSCLLNNNWKLFAIVHLLSTHVEKNNFIPNVLMISLTMLMRDT